MRIEKHILLIIFFILLHTWATGNNHQLDSLIETSKTAKDTTLINTLLRIADIFKYSNQDTAIYYLGKAEKEAIKIHFEKGYAKALFVHGNVLYFNNNYSEAKDYFRRGLELSENGNNKLLEAKCLERLASLHLTTNDPNLALKLYYESLVIYNRKIEK